jgi:PsbP-like protein
VTKRGHAKLLFLVGLAGISLIIISPPNLVTAQFNTVPENSGVFKDPEINYLTYENNTLGIRIQYPADWQVKAHQSGVEFLSPPVRFVPMQNYTNALPITLIPATVGAALRIEPVQNVSLLELVHNFISYLQTQDPIHKHFAIIATNLSGIPASIIQQEQGEGQMKVTRVLAAQGNKIYLLNYGYYSDYLPQTIQKMVNSFQIIK